jgi:hypothetical protein
MRRHGLTVERAGDRVEVAIKVDLTRGNKTSLAYTKDLAVDGCFLHTHDAFAIGDRVTLAFQLPAPAAATSRWKARCCASRRAGSR